MIARFAKQSRAWTALAAALVIGLGAVALTDAVGAEPADKQVPGSDAAPSTKPASGASDSSTTDYRIGAKDVIQVTIHDLEGPGLETVKSVRVSESGGVTVPYLKDAVTVGGLTEVDAQRAIADAYKKAGVVDQASVGVAVVEARNFRPMINAGERVTVSIMDLTGPGVETTKTGRVDEDGNISLPMIGLVKAKGLRGVELEKAIAQAYNAAGLIETAVVAVSLPDRGESHRLAAKGGESVIGPAGGLDPGAFAGAGGAPRTQQLPPLDPAMREALERKLPEFSFDGVGLSDVFDFLRDVTSLNISVDWRGLEAAGVERNTPVSVKLKDVPVQDALRILLEDVDRSLRLEAGGNVLRVTVRADPAPAAARPGGAAAAAPPPPPPPASRPTATLERRTYNVVDLLGMNAAERKAELIETILQNVRPASWRNNGGEGSATIFGSNLIVNADAAAHKEVDALLAMLRKVAAERPLPPGATRAEDMTVEQIAEVDQQMANHLKLRDEINFQIESQKLKGLGPNTTQVRTLTDTLTLRQKLITERADWFRTKYKGFYFTPDNKMAQR